MLWTLALPLLLAATPADVGWREITAGLPVVEVRRLASTECFPFLVDNTNSYYCDQDRTIYLGGDYTNQDGVALFLIFHELGHAQEERLPLRFEDKFPSEQYADCVAGQYMRQHPWITEDDREEARDLLRDQWPTESHGTPAQRIAAFDDVPGVCS